MPRHDQVGRVVVALALHEARVEIRERRVEVAHAFREHLEFLARAPLDECAHDEVIDDLLTPPFAHRLHHAGNPRALARDGERDAALAQKLEHEFKVLELFNGDGVELGQRAEQFLVFFEIQRGGRRFSLQMRMIHEHRREVGADLRQPEIRNLFTPEQHATHQSPSGGAGARAQLGYGLLLHRLREKAPNRLHLAAVDAVAIRHV